jgi:hypothetical protein
MPCSASSRTCPASSGLSTSTPTSVFHSTERGSKLNEPMNVFRRSKIIALLCRLESEPPTQTGAAAAWVAGLAAQFIQLHAVFQQRRR